MFHDIFHVKINKNIIKHFNKIAMRIVYREIRIPQDLSISLQ